MKKFINPQMVEVDIKEKKERVERELWKAQA